MINQELSNDWKLSTRIHDSELP